MNAVRRYLSTKSPARVNYAAINKSITQCKSINEIDAFVSKNVDWNDVNIATAISTLTRNRSRNLAAYHKVFELSLPFTFRPRELSNICYSIANAKFFNELPAPFAQKLQEADVTKFSPFDISNTVWALAKLECKDNAFLEKLAEEIVKRDLQKFEPRQISIIAWACGKLGYRNTVLLQNLAADFTTRDLSTFTPQALANIVWACAKLDYKDYDLLQKLAVALEFRDLKPFDYQVISNILWACAKLNFKREGLIFRFTQDLMTRDLSKTEPQVISNIMWACAKLNLKHDALISHLTQDLMTRDLCTAEPQFVSNIMWACATLDYKDEVMFAHLAQHLLVRDPSAFEPQAFANIVWACATLDYKDEALLARIVQDLLTRDLSTFMPQDISNIAWAFAKLDFNPDELSSRIAQDLLARDLSSFTPQAIANIVWALAKLEYKNDVVLARFAQYVMTQDLSAFTLQVIANISWAFAKLDFKHDEFSSRIAQDLTARDLSTFAPQTITNIAWAFAVSRVNTPAMFQRFADAVLSNPQLSVSKMTTQELSSLLYACALVNYRNDALLNELACELFSRESLSLQATVNSMWAFVCLDALNLEQVKRWFSKPSNVEFGQETHAADVIVARQLFQVKLAWQQIHGEPFPVLIDSLCEGEWIDATLLVANEKESESSRVHLRIAKMLEKQFTLQNETNLLGGISVDIFIPEHNAVVEVDGPSHFFSNEPEVRTGTTVFKHRLLERAGYKLISVPTHEFAQADAEQYIKDLGNRIIK